MTLFRTLDIILVVVMISAAAITYKVKYDAQRRLADVHRIETLIEAEKNTIHLRRAEWSLLTQPARMLQLVTRYQTQLALTTIEPRQIASLKDIPERLPDQIENLINQDQVNDHMEILASGRKRNTDPIQTGSVRR